MTSVGVIDDATRPTPSSTPDRTVGWPIVGVFAALTLVVLVWHLRVLPLADPHYGLFDNYADLMIYRAGGDKVADGLPLYDGPVLWKMQFTYTPFAALLFVPFALVSQDVANAVWWSTTFAALLAVVALSFRSLGYRYTRQVLALSMLLAVVVTSFEPVRTTIWLAQINIFLLLILVGDLSRPVGSRWRGVGAGIAAGIKLTPGLFLVYLALTRQWRACAIGVAALGATVLIGFAAIPRDSWRYWTKEFGSADRVGGVDGPANQSVNGFLAQMLKFHDVTRYLNPQTRVFETPTWMWLLFAIPALVLGLAAAAVAHRRGSELLALVLTGMTASMVSPFSWGHHWVWFVPLFVLALHHAMSGTARWRWLVPAGVFFVAAVCTLLTGAVGKRALVRQE